ncbi:salicylate synthase [Protofrankia symbiont of Coriaria ruscifolia]|uniref:Isochorismate synthase/isochorismate-pyruvate lyase MbtI n=1 Tax=Candidatus Protofrankia californiensis TaxID=1839754 RepID=A0A1C3PG61_9ACTN|nr:salicylate synthase [Protofrankia symbiont of Coriaria ruscifolia]SBW28815.1 Isochorismate synthase/isochorismate-pyruvate lyase MbtI [Candidatus Protofrankia californiensis]
MTTLLDTAPPPSEPAVYRTRSTRGRFDPAALATTLAAAGLAEHCVLYERGDDWWYAAGVLCAVSVHHDRAVVRYGDQRIEHPYTGSPLRALAELTADLPVMDWHGYGWLAFEFAQAHERPVALPRPGADPAPLAQLVVPRVEARISTTSIDVRAVDDRTLDRVLDIAARLPGASCDRPPAGRRTPVDVHTPDGDAYRSAVARAVERIEAGHLAKVILSRRVPVPFEVDLARTCLHGRRANTPARTFLLDLPGMRATGFSPETVAEVDADGFVRTQPLAGTRALGLGGDRDRINRGELCTDPKELYEHAISVRASDAELRTVCQPDSVAVRDFMSVRARGSVQHLGSHVEGRLRGGASCWDAIGVLFPAVTASGIPKAAACREIADLEPGARGLYAGAVFQVGHDGTLDAALALRAVFTQDGRSWLRAGAGVVAGSRPDREYTETCEKLASIAPYLVAADAGGVRA